MRLGRQFKPDEARLDYDIDYEELGALGDDEVVQSVSPRIDMTDGELEIDSVQFSDTVAKVWVSGGTAGLTYRITVIMSTNQGRTHEHCFDLRVRNC